MLYQHKASQVTSAEPEATESLGILTDLYAYPTDLDRPFVRANMIASVDGASAVDGASGALGSDGDRAIFRVLRGLADVVVVGARTAVVENYRLPQPDDAFSTARRDAGRREAPLLALVSNSLSIDPDYPPLAESGTVVLTCSGAPEDRRAALTGTGATIIDCGISSVDFAEVLTYLGGQGLNRVLCEGGPRLLGSVIADDLLDELCVSTSPCLVAGDAPRIVTGETPEDPRSMRPAQVLSDDEGFVYTRWTRADQSE